MKKRYILGLFNPIFTHLCYNFENIQKGELKMKKIFFSLSLLLTSFLLAESITYIEEVRVTSSTPEYRKVTTRTPIQECWDEQVPVQYAPQQNNSGSGTVGALIGGAAGGILGHQVGGGSGKTAATVGGAIVGTLVGKNLGEQNSYQAPPQQGYRTERRCNTRYEEQATDQFVGYKNVATYKNQTIVKYSDKPLEFIRINVTASY